MHVTVYTTFTHQAFACFSLNLMDYRSQHHHSTALAANCFCEQKTTDGLWIPGRHSNLPNILQCYSDHFLPESIMMITRQAFHKAIERSLTSAKTVSFCTTTSRVLRMGTYTMVSSFSTHLRFVPIPLLTLTVPRVMFFGSYGMYHNSTVTIKHVFCD